MLGNTKFAAIDMSLILLYKLFLRIKQLLTPPLKIFIRNLKLGQNLKIIKLKSFQPKGLKRESQFTIALTFFGSIYILFIEIINPKYRISVLWNLYLSISNCKLALRRAYKINSTYFQCLARLFMTVLERVTCQILPNSAALSN